MCVPVCVCAWLFFGGFAGVDLRVYALLRKIMYTCVIVYVYVAVGRLGMCVWLLGGGDAER